MLVKINKKPIKVEEESEVTTFDPIYFCVSVTGFGAILWLVDMVCFTFFFYHPFPFMVSVAKVISWFF
ncbi:hypothetical protein Bfsp1_26 [Cytobacillus phage Bfsp1]|nr:hypothetical protein Bfsp1_26 [Cytobacillus phage Bfsp1]